MKKICSLASLALCAFSEITPEVQEKYSVEILQDGEAGT